MRSFLFPSKLNILLFLLFQKLATCPFICYSQESPRGCWLPHPHPCIFCERLELGCFRIFTGLSSWEVRCSQGSLTLMKDGLMGLVTCRSALKPHSHSTNHQRLMSGSERDAAGPSWSEVGSSYNQGTVWTLGWFSSPKNFESKFQISPALTCGPLESLEWDRTKGEKGCLSWDFKWWAVHSAYNF